MFRLLSDAKPGGVLLIEQVDRLSRLMESDWRKLQAESTTRQIRVVALDPPTSWTMANARADEFTARMFDAINGRMLGRLAAVARMDYEDRRRQARRQATAKADRGYRGRPEDTERNAIMAGMLSRGLSYSQIQDATPSRTMATRCRSARAPTTRLSSSTRRSRSSVRPVQSSTGRAPDHAESRRVLPRCHRMRSAAPRVPLILIWKSALPSPLVSPSRTPPEKRS